MVPIGMNEGDGRAPSGQALAVPATPASAVDGPTGFDPSRKTCPWTFKFHGERRAAYSRACATLLAAGFSVGSRQRGAPTGVMFGDYLISKWRNMTDAERDQLHGRIFADHEPVSVYFGALPDAVDDAVFAMHNAIATEARRAETTGSVHEGAGRESGIAQESPNDPS